MVKLEELDEVHEVIREMVREELSKHETDGRRSQNLIRDLIQKELQKRPKTEYELQKAIDADKRTVQKALKHLRKLGVVLKYEPDSEEVSDTTYWRLTE
jgi:Fic family protein